MGPDGGGKPQPSDEEAADANQRNRAISSSAINRALADANSGTCNFTDSVTTFIRAPWDYGMPMCLEMRVYL